MAVADELGDAPDEEPIGPPLPPEDRLWRHPSELASTGGALPLDPIAVRRRWLRSQPSRASAWSAGLAGALLATGLVALGTHLAGALTQRTNSGPTIDTASVASTIPLTTSVDPVDNGMGASLRAVLERVGDSVATISLDNGNIVTESLGLVVRSDGMLLTSASGLNHSTSLLVTLADGETYVGQILGTDPETGLAVVHVNGVRSLPAISLSALASPSVGDVALAVTAPGGSSYTWGMVRGLDLTPTLDGTRLVDAIATDVPAMQSPLGAAVLDPAGQVVGIVAAKTPTGAAVVPAWLAAPVARELMNVGVVSNGWLGVDATTVAGGVSGVRLVSVIPGGAAQRAGLEPGDDIVSINGAPVTNLVELRARLHTYRAGATVLVGLVRAGGTIERSVRLASAH